MSGGIKSSVVKLFFDVAIPATRREALVPGVSGDKRPAVVSPRDGLVCVPANVRGTASRGLSGFPAGKNPPLIDWLI